MFTTPIKAQTERICPNAPRKNRIVNIVNNAENLVSRNLYLSFNRYRNVPRAPTKVRVHLTREYMKPVILFRL